MGFSKGGLKTGGVNPTLSNPAIPIDLMQGKEAINSLGEILTGTLNSNSVFVVQNGPVVSINKNGLATQSSEVLTINS